MVTNELKVGDMVSWSSQAGGHTCKKTGVIVGVVPPGITPPDVKALGFVRMFGKKTRVSPRGHISYLVQVGTTMIYWPLASQIAKTHIQLDPQHPVKDLMLKNTGSTFDEDLHRKVNFLMDAEREIWAFNQSWMEELGIKNCTGTPSIVDILLQIRTFVQQQAQGMAAEAKAAFDLALDFEQQALSAKEDRDSMVEGMNQETARANRYEEDIKKLNEHVEALSQPETISFELEGKQGENLKIKGDKGIFEAMAKFAFELLSKGKDGGPVPNFLEIPLNWKDRTTGKVTVMVATFKWGDGLTPAQIIAKWQKDCLEMGKILARLDPKSGITLSQDEKNLVLKAQAAEAAFGG